ncbi:DMT family transporter [Fluviicola sp.]|jgi:drug/metabolite transporter (DMT)-like permease|uniref:DMT family transporter n=1 Tax=Fluviicola sp. TaxID=1917219 RepID=UPI002839159E|nr:DMT family transporter [Fluviicola sp.]MDR0802249.1 DMT family transporter [Fluviicola sp.]
MFQKFRYHILLHLIIFMWGFTGILGKLIRIDTQYLVWHRILIAFLSLLIGLYLLKMPMRIRNTKALLKVFGVGIIVALHWISFYTSIKLSTASLGILCLSTTTLHVTWLEPLVFKKRFSPVEFIFGLLVIFGIYFVSDNFNEKQFLALAAGLSAALLAALFSVFNAKLAEEIPPSTITLHEMGIGLVFISGMLFYNGKLNTGLFQITWSDFGWLLFLGVCCTSFAFIATIEVMKRLGAFTVSLSINLEPVYTILLAIPVLHEDELLNGNFYAGSAMIILVVIANAIYKAKQRSRELKKEMMV